MTLTDEARQLIMSKGGSVYVSQPHTVSGCCFEVTDCPSVHFGRPKQASSYDEHLIRDVSVFIPKCLSDTQDLEIQRKDILGFRRLVLSGWRLI